MAVRLLRRGCLVFALLALGAPLPARALPLLKLWLDGDVHTLGRGGAEAFRSDAQAALSLERPTLLAATPGGFASLDLSSESTLSVHSGDWAGTEIHDRSLTLTAASPLQRLFPSLGVLAFASVGRDSALTQVSHGDVGTVLRLSEGLTTAVVGLTAALPYGLTVAASGAQGGQSGYATEIRWQAGPALTLWERRVHEGQRLQLTVPRGAAPRIDSPELLWAIDSLTDQDELGGALTFFKGRAFARGGAVLQDIGTYWFETGGTPRRGLTVRAGADGSVVRLQNDPMSAAGTGPVATVDLGVHRDRLFAGADLDVTRSGALHLRYIHSTLTGTSQAQDLGSATARALLSVDVDLGLLVQGGYALTSDQIALGWDGIPLGGAFSCSVGGQVMRITTGRGVFDVHSDTLARSLATDATRPARADVIGLTAGLAFHPGLLELSLAGGQLVPVAFDDGSTPSGGGALSPPSTGGGGGGGGHGGAAGFFDGLSRAFSSISTALSRYGGGSVVLARARVDF